MSLRFPNRVVRKSFFASRLNKNVNGVNKYANMNEYNAYIKKLLHNMQGYAYNYAILECDTYI